MTTEEHARWKGLDVDPDEARELLRAWADMQHDLHRRDVADGRPQPLGLDDDRHAAIMAPIMPRPRRSGAVTVRFSR
jgi:hypothetical protein